jgi:hypothetical protein
MVRWKASRSLRLTGTLRIVSIFELLWSGEMRSTFQDFTNLLDCKKFSFFSTTEAAKPSAEDNDEGLEETC